MASYPNGDRKGLGRGCRAQAASRRARLGSGYGGTGYTKNRWIDDGWLETYNVVW